MRTALQRPQAAWSTRACATRRCVCSSAKQRSGVSVSRRAVALSAAALLLARPASGFAREREFTTAGGLQYIDVQVGQGEAPAPGDTVKVVYSAHALEDPSGAVGSGKVFDPYGSAGSSTSKSYKLTLGGSESDLPVLKGWELSMLGDGAGLPPMLPGGRRIVRIPPALAYGTQGYLCRRGNIAACEVPPNAWVEFDTVLIGRSY